MEIVNICKQFIMLQVWETLITQYKNDVDFFSINFIFTIFFLFIFIPNWQGVGNISTDHQGLGDIAINIIA